MRSSATHDKSPPLLWAVLLLLALVVVAIQTRSDGWLQSNVFELLPKSQYEPLTEAATRRVDAELGTRLIFFVGHSQAATALSTAEKLAADLREQALIASVTLRVDDAQYSELVNFYLPYRSRMLSQQQLTQLADDPDGVKTRALAQIFSPFGSGGALLASDPFGLFPESMQALQPSTALELRDGMLWAHKDDRAYVFLMAQVVSPEMSIAEQESLAEAVNDSLSRLADAAPGLDVLKTGFSFYAHEATQSAKGEISTIGLGSIVGLLLLVLSTFRSLRPLGLIVTSILAGCIVALATTLTIFGSVHLFTLVFGASLIGVSVDYGFHYVADDAFGGCDWSSRRGLRNIFMGITLGLLTSILAYLALTVAPFPGLQQLAVFSSAGLLGAYATLLCIARLWRRRFTLHERSPVLSFARGFLNLWQRELFRHRLVVFTLLVVFIAIALRSVDIDDNVRTLQSQPEELQQQEAAIQGLLGIAQAGTFVLSSASTVEELLQLEEQIRSRLDEKVSSGALSGYQALSRWVPSAERQAQSFAAYSGFLHAELPGLFATIGATDQVAAETLETLTAAPPQIDIDTWLDHPVSAPFRNLWLDLDGEAPASIMLLFGVTDVAEFGAIVADLPNASIVNKGESLSVLFGQYRARVGQVLVAAYVIILFGLALRYGLRRAAVLLLPPILAGLVALATVSVAGEALNLFNFLALILVLGIGIDFTLFIAEAKEELTSTMFAITLSAITTMLSFGLLSLSSTFAVHSFGITVLIGIACAYLLSPLAIGARKQR